MNRYYAFISIAIVTTFAGTLYLAVNSSSCEERSGQNREHDLSDCYRGDCSYCQEKPTSILCMKLFERYLAAREL